MIADWIPALAIWVTWSFACALNACVFLRRLRRRPSANPAAAYAPPALVVAAVKGRQDGHDRQIEQLLAQQYPNYRVVFAVESRADPAFDFLARKLAPSTGAIPAFAGPGLRSVEIIVAGLSEDEGQKVHNLRAALDKLEDADQVIAFVDADAELPADWLIRLVQPLQDPTVGVSTGYRWLIPRDGDWASSFASVMNASVATVLGPRYRNSSWAGSMALTRRVFDEIDVRALWRGALNDDTLLAQAVRRHGLDVGFAEGLLLLTPVRYEWPGLFEFVRRQYFHVRVCRPEIWLGAATITTGYLNGWFISFLIFGSTGSPWPVACMAAVILLDRLRAGFREEIVRVLFGPAVTKQLGRVWLLERWGTALVTALHAVLVWSAVFGNRVTWSGVRYRVRGPRQTEILSRDTGL